MSTSDTPRTDRLIKNCNGWHHVPAEFARELERALNALQKDRDLLDALLCPKGCPKPPPGQPYSDDRGMVFPPHISAWKNNWDDGRPVEIKSPKTREELRLLIDAARKGERI